MNNELLETVDKFSYLDSRIALNGSVTSEVKARIGKAVGAFASLNPIWKQKKIPRNIKIKIFNACVKTILIYGNETWPINKSDVKNCKLLKRDAFKNQKINCNYKPQSRRPPNFTPPADISHTIKTEG